MRRGAMTVDQQGQLWLIVLSFLLGIGGYTATSAEAQAIDLQLDHFDVDKTNSDREREEGAPAANPWFVPTRGYQVEPIASDGSLVIRLFQIENQPAGPFGNLMRMVSAESMQGHRVRLTAQLRVIDDSTESTARMWMRVDRAEGGAGGFDNMHDRPVTWERNERWKDAKIELDVAPDASQVAIGFMLHGGGAIELRKVELTQLDAINYQAESPRAALEPRGLRNLTAAIRLYSAVRYFSPTSQTRSMQHWDHFLIDLLTDAEPLGDDEQLADYLETTFRPFAPELVIWTDDEDAQREPQSPFNPAADERDPATRFGYWLHRGVRLAAATPVSIYSSRLLFIRGEGDSDAQDVPPRFAKRELVPGIHARLATRVIYKGSDSLPRLNDAQRAAFEKWSGTGSEFPRLTTKNRSTRLADVAVTWSLLRQFYPYGDEMNVEWNHALDVALSKAATDFDERELHETLELLVAKLKDGHARVVPPMLVANRFLPFQLVWAGADQQELVVTAVHDVIKDDVRIGDIIRTINGVDVEKLHQRACERISGATEGWLRHRSADKLAFCNRRLTVASIEFERPGLSTPKQLSVPTVVNRVSLTVNRPANGSEVAPGVVYFNLVGATAKEFEERLDQLALARGIVFDLRGYPSTGAMKLMPHLIDQPSQSPQWLVAAATEPVPAKPKWVKLARWDLRPAQPHLDMPIAFLTDGSAISYAESIMGIVEHYRLGEIVGSTTAGTNGNVNTIRTPSGFQIPWTGMRVLKHDGSQHHGVGIAPTLPVTPTPEGIAAGRDEVLERAILVLLGKLAGEGRP